MGLRNWITSAFRGSEQTTVTRASKGISRDYYSAVSRPYMSGREDGTPSPENLNILLEMLQKDPVINAAINTRVNSIIDSGWTTEGEKTPLSSALKKLKKVGLNFNFMKKLFLNGLLYRHVFIEIERDANGNEKNLYILETPQMEIKHDPHGEITKFVQNVSEGDNPEWGPEDIVYIPFDSISTSVWGEIELKTLYRTVATKNFIEEFINSMAVSNAWRQVIKTKMKGDEIGEFLSYYYDALSDPLNPLVMQIPEKGDAKDEVWETLRDPAELKEFLGLLDYLRTQILMVLKVPPIIVGLPDSSNRSNSESQFKIYNMNNESDRIIVRDAFNNDLFPKMGLSTVEFSWNPIDKRTTKEDVEIAEKLMNMGANRDKVEEFLRKAGVELPDGKFFDEPEVMETKTPDDAASRPSRKREDKAADMQNKGTGSESSTRADQMGG